MACGVPVSRYDVLKLLVWSYHGVKENGAWEQNVQEQAQNASSSDAKAAFEAMDRQQALAGLAYYVDDATVGYVVTAFIDAHYVADTPSLCEAIALKKVPHWTTLQKASKRLLRNEPVQKLLDASVARASPRRRRKRRPRVRRGALDSSGFESHHCSSYFVRRRAKGRKDWQKTTYRRFPKLDLLCDCDSHLILAAAAERGPGPDITHFQRVVFQACGRVRLQTLLADAGYDGEWVHELARQEMDIRTLIPAAIGRPTDKAPTGYWRRVMSERLHLASYGQRRQVETAFSVIKRRLGSAVNARTYWPQCRALMLKAVTHNILILYAPSESRRAAA